MLEWPRFKFENTTVKNPFDTKVIAVSIFNKEFKVGDTVRISYVTNLPTSDEKEVIIEGELVEIWTRWPRSDNLLMHLNGGVNIKTNEGKIENIPIEFICDIDKSD